MRKWIARSLVIACCTVFVALAVRVMVAAAQMETGFEFVGSTVRDAILRWVGLSGEPVASRDPSQQADFWLAEADRVLGESPNSAELALGAAWVLDAPSLKYDDEAIDRATEPFLERCRDRCVQLAETATRLKPNNVNAWRHRALLQFTDDLQPRHPQWRQVLEECAQHDPDNALYDYLIARYLYQQSAHTHVVNGDIVAAVDHPALFAEANERFLAGVKKPFFVYGEQDNVALIAFLRASSLPKLQHADVAKNHLPVERFDSLYHQLGRWQLALFNGARQREEWQRAAECVRTNLQFEEQVLRGRETQALVKQMNVGSRKWWMYRLRRLAFEHPEYISAEVYAREDTRDRELRIQGAVVREALNRLTQRNPRGDDEISSSVSVLAGRYSIHGAGGLLPLAAIFALAALLVGGRYRGESSKLGVLRHAVAWTLGISLTFVVFGLAPAEVISHEVQTWTVIVLSAVLATIASIALLWWIYRAIRKRGFKFSLLAMLIAVTLLALGLVLWPLIYIPLEYFEYHPVQLWMPALGRGAVGAGTLQSMFENSGATWQWTIVQWEAYCGPSIGVALSLALVATWFAVRSAQRASTSMLRFWSTNVRSRGGALLACLSRSSAIVGLALLLVYLCVAPTLIELAEEEYRRGMRYFDNLWHIVDTVEREAEEIKRDAAAMRALESEVDQAIADDKAGRVPEHILRVVREAMPK
jgi:hypothetical protein